MSNMVLPLPLDLGVSGYPSWRPRQDEAAAWVIGEMAEHRIVGLCAPTGSGKSLIAWAASLIAGHRTFFLTPTKALQDQYRDTLAVRTEWPEAVDVRGQSSYRCAIAPPGTTVEDGPCHSGYDCQLRRGGCGYFDAVRESRKAEMVVSNPAWFMSMGKYGEGWGEKVDMLVVDEADTLLDNLSNFRTVTMHAAQVERLLGVGFPREGQTIEQLVRWARGVLPLAEKLKKGIDAEIVERGANPGMSRRKREVERLAQGVRDIASIEGEWAVRWGKRGVWFSAEPVWPSEYVERVVFKGIPHVLLMSGTLTEEDVQRIAGADADYAYSEWPAVIPVADRRVVHVKTCPMSFGKANYPLWVSRIDQIIGARLDRKLILHTTSYERRDRYVLGSRFRGKDILITHGGEDLDQAVAEFKAAKPPAVLVSPSVVRGYDFPGAACETAIIGKVPWPDTRDPVAQARKERDPTWPNHAAMKAVEQAAGRHVRYLGDRGETIIVDNDFQWFWKYNNRLATASFRGAVAGNSLETIPAPPTKIREGG